MLQNLDFDPTVYFSIVADNLISNLGERALQYAGAALQKMRDMGDDEGFELWIGVQSQIEKRIYENELPVDVTVH